jgi:hypothetical protein
MKMVKSLLLGTAAGFVAIAGAQAADLPVKAKPVQYVKICSLYGAGFYYIPGTDMCLKIGGWTRVYDAYNVNGNSTNGALASGNANVRATQDFAPKVRGYITADARNQTEYGTVRSYLAVGYSSGGPNNGVTSGNTTAPGTNATLSAYDPGQGFSANRAFIQFAGFTFGVTTSFYDIYSQPATSFFGGMINPASDTGDAGKFVAGAYTAMFGAGLSATISAEAARATTVINGNNTMWTNTTGAAASGNLGLAPTSSAEGTKWPDVVLNLRVDQPWGSAQIMGAIHNAAGQYYGANDATGATDNAVGWAVGAGFKINAPMIGAGDYLQAQVNYAEGASGYVNASYSNTYSAYNGGSYGFGIISDGVYGGTLAGASTTGIQLTTAWGANVAYEHFWSPHWQTSVYGAYQAFSYGATGNAWLCNAENVALGSPGLTTGAGTTLAAAAACNNNFSVWNIGSRTQFNLDSQTYLGVDIVYQQLNTALGGVIGGAGMFGNGAEAAGSRTISNQSAWMGEFRVHRNFYP